MSSTLPPPLFGRSAELAEIRRLLTDENVRFLTLTGPGGIGKTRLAYAFAADEAAHPGRTAYLVDLAVVDDAAQVPPSVAHALHVQESGSEPLLSILRDIIARRDVLLVLDNFERVMDAASFVADLVASAPRLSCLATSREPLHIRAERVFPVEPLPVPPMGSNDFAAISNSPAVALFEDRARARRPDFAVSPANATEISEICRRLDGLPLAIELAAAEVSVLAPRIILARLEAQQPFVLGAGRDFPARHRTLAAAVAWSYELLTPSEQRIFRHCGVFSGAFRPSAVSAVVSEQADNVDEVLGILARLADKNLLQVATQGAAEPYFRLLETIRSFAVGVLAESGEMSAARHRHALYFAEVAEQAEHRLVGPAMAETLDQLEQDYDNFRSVLSWSVDDDGDLVVGLRLAGALYRFWMLRGHLGEARGWFDRALPRSEDAPVAVRGKAFNAAGVVAGLQGDNSTAESFFRKSFSLWEGVGDPIRMAAALGNMGLVAQDRQEVELALECFRRAEALYARGGDQRGIAVSIGSRAHLARQQGNTREALELFHSALAVFREIGDPRAIANCLANLGHALLALEEPRRSLDYFREALELRQTLGDKLGTAECFEGFAAAAAAMHRPRRAARLLGAAAALRQTTGAPLPAADRDQYEAVVRRIQQQLDSEGIGREQAIGHGLTPAEAVEYALSAETRPAATTKLLSVREHQIAMLVAEGLTNRQIAERLLLTPRTVTTHLEHIFSKLDVRARAEVAAWITRHIDRLAGRGE